MNCHFVAFGDIYFDTTYEMEKQFREFVCQTNGREKNEASLFIRGPHYMCVESGNPRVM